jgi:hypothetical protein
MTCKRLESCYSCCYVNRKILQNIHYQSYPSQWENLKDPSLLPLPRLTQGVLSFPGRNGVIISICLGGFVGNQSFQGCQIFLGQFDLEGTSIAHKVLFLGACPSTTSVSARATGAALRRDRGHVQTHGSDQSRCSFVWQASAGSRRCGYIQCGFGPYIGRHWSISTVS